MVKENVYIIYILLTAMALLSTSSHGISIVGLRLGQGEINGVLLCDLNGDPNAPPVYGAPVYLRCGGASSNIAEAVTNPDGTFTVLLNTLQTIFVSPSNCGLVVNLPGGNCTLIVPDGILTSTFTLVSIVQRDNINTAVFLAGPFLEGII